MSNYLLSIKDKVVIVTGGGKGIGRVYCRELAKAGCKVVAADIDDSGNAETVSEIEELGGKAISATTDVSDETQTQ
ncbi:MAG: SDR family NAD(P)-dependent oxidoreductase, partial [Pseudomonadota bacterium]|nr:SDR family NAD(P)-dependent oxidoreductase [Pseudomonadota bacterium]